MPIFVHHLTSIGGWVGELTLKAYVTLTHDPHFNSHTELFFGNSAKVSNTLVHVLSALGPSSQIDGQLEW